MISDPFAILSILDADRKVVVVVLAAIAILGILLMPQSPPKGARRGRGPLYLPWLGSPGLLLRKETRYHWMNEQMDKYGLTYSMGLPGQHAVLTANPANVEHILKTNFTNYEKSHHFKRNFGQLLGHGIFNTDGQRWKEQRKLGSHMFSNRILREHMTPVFVRHSQLVVEHLERAADSGELIDLQDLFYRFTLDSVGEIAFGVNVGALENADVPFAKAFARAQETSADRFFNPLWKLAKLFGTGRERHMSTDIATLNAFAEQVISERRNAPDLEQRGDLLSRFMLARDENGQPFDDSYLRDVMLNYLIAGQDTTAQALSWCSWELMQHPEIAEKLATESQALLPDGALPTFETAGNMEYGAAVFQEALRLHPSVPMDPKATIEPDVLPDGTFVPAGCLVVYAPWSMGRRPELWGDDCLEFKPERFVGAPPPSPFKFAAFQAGYRTCLGINMAPLEAKIALSLITPRFVFEHDPTCEVTYGMSATLAMKNGLRVRVKRRTCAAACA